MINLFQNEYVIALIILLIFVIFAKACVYVMQKFLKKLTEKTKTDLDDKILELATPTAYVLIIYTGFHFALRSLSVLEQYKGIIDNASFVIMTIILAVALTKLMRTLVLHWLHVRKRFEKAPQLISKIINVIIYLISFLIVLDHFKISITPILATLGVGAVAVGLALQGTLSNLFAGIRILSDRLINIGDFIEVDGKVSGIVEDIRWSTTTVHTLTDTIVIIPNSKVVDSIVMNYSMPQEPTSIGIQCGVSYKSNLKKVEKAVLEVAEKIQKNVKGAVRGFKPSMGFNGFGDYNILFSVTLKAEKVTDKYLITHEFIKTLKERFDREKISIFIPNMKTKG